MGVEDDYSERLHGAWVLLGVARDSLDGAIPPLGGDADDLLEASAKLTAVAAMLQSVTSDVFEARGAFKRLSAVEHL